MSKYTDLFNGRMKLGFILLCVLVLTAFIAPWVWPYDSLKMNLSQALQPPSFLHPFGLDENGMDVFTQVIHGARVSLIVASAVVLINLLVGLIVGSISALQGGIVDQMLMRLVDLVSAFPRFLLALAILAMLGSSLYHLIFAMCLSGWSSFARLVRAEILYLKKEDYVLGAWSYGASSIRVLVCHIWPNLLGLALVHIAFSLAAVMIGEAGLSFLGLGLPPEVPSWGRLISSGRGVLMEAPHLSLFPGIALCLAVLGFQLCAESLRDYFDPHAQKKVPAH